MAELTAALALADAILGLIEAGTMTVMRGREVFSAFNAKLAAVHAEGRTMSDEELAAYFAEGDQVVLGAMQTVRDARARVEQLPE